MGGGGGGGGGGHMLSGGIYRYLLHKSDDKLPCPKHGQVKIIEIRN